MRSLPEDGDPDDGSCFGSWQGLGGCAEAALSPLQQGVNRAPLGISQLWLWHFVAVPILLTINGEISAHIQALHTV